MSEIFCLIMAGGSGTRFWPASRNARPKQYLNIGGEDSLIRSTIQRFSGFCPQENIYVVSSRNQAEILEKQASMLPAENLVYEPAGRNTLPCIGLAAMIMEKRNPGGILVVSPSDHLISNTGLFRDTVLAAVDLADQHNGMVTLGITPLYPATGYGYVKTAEEVTSQHPFKQFRVERFVEKPDETRASAYLKEGGYYWNSGLFVFRIPVFLDAVKKFTPDLYASLRKIQEAHGTANFRNTLDTVYPSVKSISVDYGIMEHAGNIFLVEGKFDWNDLGSWESVYQIGTRDQQGNVTSGDVVCLDTANSFIHTDNGIVAVVGLDNIVVVKNGNALLVCKRDRTEDVKQVVDKLKSENRDIYL